MSEKREDGGSAFPETHVHPGVEFHPTTGLTPGWHGKSGMTLRDWYKGMALQGMMVPGGLFQNHLDYATNIAQIVHSACDLADAMIAERNK